MIKEISSGYELLPSRRNKTSKTFDGGSSIKRMAFGFNRLKQLRRAIGFAFICDLINYLSYIFLIVQSAKRTRPRTYTRPNNETRERQVLIVTGTVFRSFHCSGTRTIRQTFPSSRKQPIRRIFPLFSSPSFQTFPPNVRSKFKPGKHRSKLVSAF